MKKIFAALLLAGALVSSSVSAHGWAHREYYHRDHDFGRGRFITGLVAGAVIGSFLEPRQEYVEPRVIYQEPEYVAPARVPVYCIDQMGYRYVCGWQYVQPQDYDEQ